MEAEAEGLFGKVFFVYWARGFLETTRAKKKQLLLVFSEDLTRET